MTDIWRILKRIFKGTLILIIVLLIKFAIIILKRINIAVKILICIHGEKFPSKFYKVPL